MRRLLSALLLPAALGTSLLVSACSPIELPVVDASALPNTSDYTGPYEVTARVQAVRSIDSVVLVWENLSVDTVQAIRTPMVQDASGTYSAGIPGQGATTTIAYHVEATDSAGDIGSDPPAGSTGSTNMGCGDNYCFTVESVTTREPGATYRDAGVDIDEGDALVERIKPHAKRTLRPEVLAGIGGFGGLFELPRGYDRPVLVVGTDGVGTKLKLAFLSGRHETVGIDLVAMSVNDVVVCGAEPLVFLDYYATSGLRADQAEKVIAGVAEGCVRAGCTLIGGETAELPGFYKDGEYDLAGFCVGVVEKERILDGSRVKPGDAVLGLASNGLHSNGYSLARKVLLERAGLPLEGALLDELLAPTRIYVKECLALREALDVHAFAHITGGGLPGNLPRVLPDETRARLDENSWPRPEIFSRIASLGNVAPDEMLRTFNCGIGMCVVLAKRDVAQAQELLLSRGVPSWEIGAIESAPGLAEPEVVFAR